MSQWLRNLVKQTIPQSLCMTRLPQPGDNLLLTFDDGPHPEVTPAVLDLLQQYQAKAVFFVVGNRINRAPKVLERILAEGHWLGNHTYSHPNDRRMPFREYRRDLLKCQQTIFDHSGVRAQLHRPPHGQITMASLLAPKSCGLTTMHWSCSAEDWQFRSDEEAVARSDKMLNSIKKRDIILFHDETRHTVVALDRLLPALKSLGFGFAPILGRRYD